MSLDKQGIGNDKIKIMDDKTQSPITETIPANEGKTGALDKVEELRAEVQSQYPDVSDEIEEHLDAVAELLAAGADTEDRGTEEDVDAMSGKSDFMDELANS